MGWWAAGRLVVSASLLCASVTASQGVPSLPGDADCDGFVTSHDLVHLQEEFVDGDGAAVEEAAGGTATSCLGADANHDGSITIADTTALINLLFGHSSPVTESGPVVTFIGVANADGSVAESVPGGVVPIFRRAGLFGFYLVIEVARGRANVPVLIDSAPPVNPAVCPDLQVSFSRSLGDGSTEVCDENGVPGVFPPHIDDPALCPIFNDAACRFEAITNAAAACTTNRFGAHAFVDSRTRLQLCMPVARADAFADGSTTVTVRVLDSEGTPGETAQAIVHVGSGPPPTAIPTPTITNTRGPVPTRTITSRRTLGPTQPSRTPTATALPGAPTFTPTELATPVPATSTATAPPASPSETPTANLRTPSRTPTRSTPTATVRGTRRPTATSTRVPSATATRPALRTRTPSQTATTTASAPPTRTRTRTRTPLASATPSPTRRPPLTPTRRSTATPTREPTLRESRTPTRSPTITITPTVTRTSRPSGTPTITRTPSKTPIPSNTRTASPTPSVTRTRSPSRTRTNTRTPRPTARPGPDITFFGIGTPDYRIIQPTSLRGDVPVYVRRLGYNLTLIVEGKAGPSRRPVGSSADPFDPSGRPDIQPIVSMPLGVKATSAVCDVPPNPSIGGVPASPSFADTPAISDAISDLACRFVDGNGNPRARTSSSDACTPFAGIFRFVAEDSSTQFCALVAEYFAFRAGETNVTVRLRDDLGNLSAPKSVIIDVRP